MGLLADLEPIEIPVYDKDRKTGKITEHKVWIREFSEADIRRRTQMLQANRGSEDSRRGRSRRGQASKLQIEMLRVFNFENGTHDWNFKFPETMWDEVERVRKPHPLAGQKMPINRDVMELLPPRITDQIIDEIEAINEPPEPDVETRDEEGNLLDEEEHSPTEPSFADRSRPSSPSTTNSQDTSTSSNGSPTTITPDPSQNSPGTGNGEHGETPSFPTRQAAVQPASTTGSE